MRMAVIAAASAATVWAAAGAANAAIYLSFDDPGAGSELTHTARGTGGAFTYSPTSLVELRVDGTEDGFGVQTFMAQLVMNITTGTATQAGSSIQTRIDGDFAFRAGNETILTGTINNGVLTTFGTVGAILASSSFASLTYQAGGALEAILQARGFNALVPRFDAAFAISGFDPEDLTPVNGYLPSFTSNAAFTGNTAVPSPGTAALAGLAAACMLPRRNRRQEAPTAATFMRFGATA